MLQPAYISRTHTIRHSLHRHANPYSFNDFSITSYHTKALSRLDVISDLPKSSNSSAILPILPSKKHPSHALSLVKVILNFHDLNVSFMIITHLTFNVSTKFNFLRENLRGRVQSAPYQLSSFVLHWHTISYSFLCLHCFSHSVTEI